METYKERAVFVILFCIAAIGGLMLAWQARMILLLLFSGCIGALILVILTGYAQSLFRLRRSFSFAIVLIAITSASLIGVWTEGASLVEQLGALQLDISDAVHQLSSHLEKQSWVQWIMAHSADSARLPQALSMAIAGIGGALNLTLSTIGGLFLIILTSVYLGAEPAFYGRAIRRIVPDRSRPLFEACVASAVIRLRAWLLAKAVSMTSIGLLVAAGLFVLQVPLAGTLGAIAALLTFIPNLGPILSVLPAALIAFAISPLTGLLTVTLYCFAHFLEGNVITPIAERNIASLPPALTLAMQLLLGSAAGALGIVLAAPFTAALLGVLQVLLPPAGPKSNALVSEPANALYEEWDAVVKMHGFFPLRECRHGLFSGYSGSETGNRVAPIKGA